MADTSTSKIHPLVWFLLTGTFLSRVALFITLPFISIYMTTYMDATPIVTGIVSGLGPLCGIISAFLMGYASDKFGRKDVLKFSLLVWAFAFLGFSFSKSVWQFALFNMIYGMSRSSFESVAMALVTDFTAPELRKRVFHLRYFAINLGACIAPPIGAWLFVQHPQVSFMITAGVYFLYFILLNVFFKKWHPFKAKDAIKANPISLSGVLSVIRSDKPLMFFLFGNMIMLLGFAQFETNLPIYLKQMHGNWGVKLFAYLTLINAITIVCLQFPTSNFTKKMNIIRLISIGFALYGVGLGSLGLFEAKPLFMMVSMFVFTLGEMLVFSNANVLIDQIGPQHLKGSYFGITEITVLGFVVGPVIGGIFMQHGHGPLLFAIMGTLAFVSIIFYNSGHQLLGDRIKK